MTTTDSRGIVFLEASDDITPFHTLINVLQTGTSNAIAGKVTDTAWASYVPVLTGVTLGNGTLTTRWNRVGNLVYMAGQCTLGSSSSVTGNITISLPVVAGGMFTGVYSTLGTGMVNDTGVTTEMVFATAATASSIYLRRTNGSAIGPGVPFTWGTGDVFAWNVAYEPAA